MKIFSLLLMMSMVCNATASQVHLPYYQEKTLTPIWLVDAPLHVIGGFEATNQLG